MPLSLQIPSDRYLISFDNEVDVNLKLSINFSLHAIILPLSSWFLGGTEKVIHFPAFSLKHSNWP